MKNIVVVSNRDIIMDPKLSYKVKKFKKYITALEYTSKNDVDCLVFDVIGNHDELGSKKYYINSQLADHVIISKEDFNKETMRSYFKNGAIDVLEHKKEFINISEILDEVELNESLKQRGNIEKTYELQQDLQKYQILYKITKLLRLNLNLESVLYKISNLILELMGKKAVFVLPIYRSDKYEIKGKLEGVSNKNIDAFLKKHDIYSPIEINGNYIIIMPMIIKSKIKGYLLLEKETPDINELGFEWINDILSQAGVIIENSKLLKQAQHINIEMAESLSFAIDAKDHYTQGHSKRVEKISELMAKKLNMGEKRIQMLKMAALLHDVGKIGLPEKILNKSTKLTEQEYGEIKKHPVKSSEIIEPIKNMKYVSSIVKQHHEKWDGTGYPNQLKREKIIFEARIISIADAFDAMTSNRSYRRGMDIDIARKEISDNKGTQFDPHLVDVFLDIDVEKLKEILEFKF